MKTKNVLIGVLLTAALAGCGHKEVGVSAESSQSTGFRGEFSQADTKSESTSQSSKSTTKQQVLTSIATSANTSWDYMAGTYYPTLPQADVKKYQGAIDYKNKMEDAEFAWLNGPGYNHLGAGGNPIDGSIFKDDAGLKSYSMAMAVPKQYDDWFEPWDTIIRQYKGGDVSAGATFLLRRLALDIFIMGIETKPAWPDYGSKLTMEQGMILYINRQARAINFANLLADEIARTMPTRFKNPSDFRHDFLEAMVKIPDADYYAMFKQAADGAGKITVKGLSIKTGGDTPPNWTSGPLQYAIDGNEWVYRVGGQTIFGRGYINGELREADLSSALEVNMKKESTDRQSESFGTDQSDKASVGVK